jgi:hypothetical protein
MGRTFTKQEDGEFVLAPEGTSTAVLWCLAYLGKHESTYQGETRLRELVGLAWELAEPAEDGRHLSVTEVLTASLNERAKFFARVLALTGKREPPEGFDLERLLGRGAVVTVAHEIRDGKTWANVTQAGPLPRGMAAPPPSVALTYYDVDAPTPEALERLPSRFRKLLERADLSRLPPSPPKAPSAAPAPKPAPAAVPFDDDIPW